MVPHLRALVLLTVSLIVVTAARGRPAAGDQKLGLRRVERRTSRRKASFRSSRPRALKQQRSPSRAAGR